MSKAQGQSKTTPAVDKLLLQAQQAIATKNLHEATDFYRQALELSPDHVRANFELAGLLHATGRTSEAVVYYQATIDADPGFKSALYDFGAISFGMGDLATAEQLFEQLQTLSPDDPKISNNLGNIAFESGNYEKAANHYRTTMNLAPDWWEAASNLASALTRCGEVSEALELYDKAIQLAPEEAALLIEAANARLENDDIERAAEILNMFRSHGNRTLESELLHGRILLAQDCFDDSIQHYQSLIAVAPDSPEIRVDLGHAFAMASRYRESFEAFEDALTHGASELLVYPNYGKALLEQGNAEKALEKFLIAEELEPDNTGFNLNVANAWYRAGNPDEALKRYRNIIAAAPENVDAILSLATLSQLNGDHQTSMEWADKVLDLEPENISAMEVRARALAGTGKLEKARETGLKILELAPVAPEGYLIMATALQEGEDYTAALEMLDEGIRHNPLNRNLLNHAFLIHHLLGNAEETLELGRLCIEAFPEEIEIETKLVNTILSCCEWKLFDKYASHLINAVENRINNDQDVAICLSNLQTLPVDYDLLVRAGRNVSNSIVRSLKYTPGRTDLDIDRDRYSGQQRIRIAYILPYVLFHSMPMQMKDLADRHDRSKFEVYGYCIQEPTEGEFASSLINSFDQFRWSESPVELAAMINEDKIGVLIDNSGHTDISCLDVCALKPAPINIHYIGYSLSLGADFMDYIISDPQIITEDQKDCGPEKMLYLDDSMAPSSREPFADDVPTRQQLGLPDDGFVFSNFNQPFKIDSQIFDVWLDILKAVPGSVMWLGNWYQRANDNLREYAERHGVDGDRFVFSDIVDHGDHLSRLSLSDLCIDTFHHGGGQTNLDCLWAGLPFISARGSTPGSSFGAFMLRAHGLSDLIVENLDDYRDLAIRLAGNPEKLAEVHQRCLDNRDTEPLFDREGMMANLERGYEAVWQRFLSGKPPEHIHVSSEYTRFDDEPVS